MLTAGSHGLPRSPAASVSSEAAARLLVAAWVVRQRSPLEAVTACGVRGHHLAEVAQTVSAASSCSRGRAHLPVAASAAGTAGASSLASSKQTQVKPRHKPSGQQNNGGKSGRPQPQQQQPQPQPAPDQQQEEGSWMTAPVHPGTAAALQWLTPHLGDQQQQQQLGEEAAVLLPTSTRPASLPDRHLEHLQQLLGLTPAGAQQLALICPEASALHPDTVTRHWQQLLQLLPVSRDRMALAVARHPWLLLHPQAVVPARLRQMAQELGVPANQQQALQQLSPQARLSLVVADPSAAAGRVQLLVQLLGLEAAAVQAAVLAVPQVLLWAERLLVSTLEALEVLSGIPLPKLAPRLLATPQLLVVAPDAVYARAAGLQQLLAVTEKGLSDILQRCPAVLAAPSERVACVLEVLEAALAVSSAEVVNLVLQLPEVLGLLPGRVEVLLQTITSTFQLSPAELEQVVQFNPQLLLLHPGPLQLRLSAFLRIVPRSRTWRQEYKVLITKPANVARTLKVDSQRLLRLLYLRNTRRDAGISLGQALGLNPLDFGRMYPGYQGWLLDWRRQREQRGQAAAAAAAAAAVGAEVTAQIQPVGRKTQVVQGKPAARKGAAAAAKPALQEEPRSRGRRGNSSRRLSTGQAAAAGIQGHAQTGASQSSTAGWPSVTPPVPSSSASGLLQPAATGGGRRFVAPTRPPPTAPAVPVAPTAAAAVAAAVDPARRRPKWPDLDEDEEEVWRDAMSSI